MNYVSTALNHCNENCQISRNWFANIIKLLKSIWTRESWKGRCRKGQWEEKRTLPSTPCCDSKRLRNYPLRIVYDGSAKPPERTHSLNDCLETGQNYTPQLFDTLVKFRWHKIGLTADTEKAFLMVGVNQTDRDMLRFLWLKDPDDPNSETVHLRFTRLVFGLRPSPAILASTIQHQLDSQVSEDFKTHFVELLKKYLYVDDFETGEGDEVKALELCSRSKSLMQREGFNLRKWKTNSKILQDAINGMNDRVNPTTEPGSTKTITKEDESYAKATNRPPTAAGNASENAIVKVLGSIWNTGTDEFRFDLVNLSKHACLLPTTKRSLLKISAKIFDPLALLSPFTIQWKVVFQELCINPTDWDDQLTGDHLKKWKSLIFELQTLNSVCIPRCYFDYTSGNLKSAELQCFCDTSEKLTLQALLFAPFIRMDALTWNWLHWRWKSHCWRNKASLGLGYLVLQFLYVWLKPNRTNCLGNGNRVLGRLNDCFTLEFQTLETIRH